MDSKFNLSEILSSINPDLNASRYKTINGIKYSHKELENMTPQQKENIAYSPQEDYSNLDDSLELLNLEYEKEIDPIKRRILIIKYDLMIEQYGPITSDSLKVIENLKLELEILKGQLIE